MKHFYKLVTRKMNYKGLWLILYLERCYSKTCHKLYKLSMKGELNDDEMEERERLEVLLDSTARTLDKFIQAYHARVMLGRFDNRKVAQD